MGQRIILVRHGETEANRDRQFATDDVSLTEAGRAQAHEVGLRLKREFEPDVLLSSEFLRARQTSEIIAGILGLATEAIPGLHERDFGSWKGRPYEHQELIPFDGESLDDLLKRSIDAVEELRLRYPRREVVVVCHGALIQAVCAHAAGDWSEAAVPPNCGIVILEFPEAGWTATIPASASIQAG